MFLFSKQWIKILWLPAGCWAPDKALKSMSSCHLLAKIFTAPGVQRIPRGNGIPAQCSSPKYSVALNWRHDAGKAAAQISANSWLSFQVQWGIERSFVLLLSNENSSVGPAHSCLLQHQRQCGFALDQGQGGNEWSVIYIISQCWIP